MRAVAAFVFCAVCISAAPSPAAVVIDRIAVIIGTHVIKASDIDLDLRVTDFLNQQPLTQTADARKKAAERLIDQQLIRVELGTGGYTRATDADAQAFLKQIRQSRFASSDPRMQAALERYGLNEAQLQAQLLWQLTVLRFIDQRFRPGILVTDDEVRAYFDQHHAELAKDNPKNSTFEALAAQIRSSLEGEKINKEFESWLASARKRNRIEYRDAAFQDAANQQGARP